MDVSPVKGPDGVMSIPQGVIDSVNRNKVGLKGPLMTPIGKGFRSLNLTIRKEFDMYANVRPCKSLPGKFTLLIMEFNQQSVISGLNFFLLKFDICGMEGYFL